MSEAVQPSFALPLMYLVVCLFLQCIDDLKAVHVDIVDFSDDHCNGAKLELVVVSDEFERLPLLKRHRKVNEVLGELLKSETIHAITIKAWTVSQYEATAKK
jgi:stress-induced morphogen